MCDEGDEGRQGRPDTAAAACQKRPRHIRVATPHGAARPPGTTPARPGSGQAVNKVRGCGVVAAWPQAGVSHHHHQLASTLQSRIYARLAPRDAHLPWLAMGDTCLLQRNVRDDGAPPPPLALMLPSEATGADWRHPAESGIRSLPLAGTPGHARPRPDGR